MSEQAYWNRSARRSGGDKRFKILLARPMGIFTQEEKIRCLDDVYTKCLLKRPELTTEQFTKELLDGKIQIKLPDGQIVKFEDL